MKFQFKRERQRNRENRILAHSCSTYISVNQMFSCFTAGMYGLAAHEEQDQNSDRWLGIAAGITNTCHESYDRTDTKLGPEAFRFTDSVEARAVKQNERYYILR